MLGIRQAKEAVVVLEVEIIQQIGRHGCLVLTGRICFDVISNSEANEIITVYLENEDEGLVAKVGVGTVTPKRASSWMDAT